MTKPNSTNTNDCRVLEISSELLGIERDACIAFDNIFGTLYEEIYRKDPDFFRSLTGDEEYISELNRSLMRWSLEAELVDVEEKEARCSIRNENEILYRGINYFHPENADRIIIKEG